MPDPMRRRVGENVFSMLIRLRDVIYQVECGILYR